MGKLNFHLKPNVPDSSIAPDDFKISDHLDQKDETMADGSHRSTWEGVIPLNIYKKDAGDSKAYIEIVQVEDADHARRFAYVVFPCWNKSNTCEQGQAAVHDMMTDAEKNPNVWTNLPPHVEIGAILFGDVNGGGRTDLLLQLTDNTNTILMQASTHRGGGPCHRPTL